MAASRGSQFYFYFTALSVIKILQAFTGNCYNRPIWLHISLCQQLKQPISHKALDTHPGLYLLKIKIEYMNRKTILLIGIVLVFIGVSITILFDIQPYIPITITASGLGIIAVLISRFLFNRETENEYNPLNENQAV